jgi:hypothetical protein
MIVARKITYFPHHPIDEPVKRWMAYHNISPNDVRAYTIERDAQGMTFISVDVFYEPPPEDIPKEQ